MANIIGERAIEKNNDIHWHFPDPVAHFASLATHINKQEKTKGLLSTPLPSTHGRFKASLKTCRGNAALSGFGTVSLPFYRDLAFTGTKGIFSSII